MAEIKDGGRKMRVCVCTGRRNKNLEKALPLYYILYHNKYFSIYLYNINLLYIYLSYPLNNIMVLSLTPLYIYSISLAAHCTHIHTEGGSNC